MDEARIKDIEWRFSNRSGKIESLRETLAELEKEQRVTAIDYVAEKYNLRVGSIVKARHGCVYRVTGWPIESRICKPWMLYGNLQKKDGTFGVAPRNIFDWELVDESR